MILTYKVINNGGSVGPITLGRFFVSLNGVTIPCYFGKNSFYECIYFYFKEKNPPKMIRRISSFTQVYYVYTSINIYY